MAFTRPPGDTSAAIKFEKETGEEIMAMFDDLHSDGQTIILITHEDHIAAHAHRTIRLRDGKIETDIINRDAVAA